MQRNKTKTVIVIVIGLISVVYLLNPGLGVFEFIPDNIPLIGNIDEAMASFLFLSALAYFGIDLRKFFIRSPRDK